MTQKILISFFAWCIMTSMFFYIFVLKWTVSSKNATNTGVVNTVTENSSLSGSNTQEEDIVITASPYAQESFCLISNIQNTNEKEYSDFLVSFAKLKKEPGLSNALFWLLKSPRDCTSFKELSQDDYQECLVKNSLKQIFGSSNAKTVIFFEDIQKEVPILLKIQEFVDKKECDSLKEITPDFIEYCTKSKDFMQDILTQFQEAKKDICE